MNHRKLPWLAVAAGALLSLGGISQRETAAPAVQVASSDLVRAVCADAPNAAPPIGGLQTAWAMPEASASGLRLLFSNQAIACRNPDWTHGPGRDDSCDPGWTFAFTLPPELQKPGVYDLHEYEVGYAETVVSVLPTNGCASRPGCSGTSMGSAGGAKGPDGTIEIDSITDACVTGRILRLERGGSSEVDFTGAFQAVVCTPGSL